jgi:protein involved in polysaccharide export with SLBB domain
LSDIVKRAGGVKGNAFVQGAVLMRKTYSNLSQTDAVLANAKTNLISQQSGKGAVIDNINDTASLKNLYNQQKPVGIQLDEAIQNPGSAADLFLVEGDILKIPTSVQTVQTFGMVNVPKQIVYRDGLSFKDAIRESGGFAVNASRKNSYVLYANGEVRATKKFLFFRSYPSIKTGAEIWVPAKRPKTRVSTGEAIGIISGLASLLGIVVVLVSTTK